MTAGLFVCPGESGPGYPIFGGDHNRSIEYDMVNGEYGRFAVEELFPAIRTKVRLTDDPKGRVICGMSSGGACAVTAAFHHPDQFGNVISHCGSFINIRGAHNLPSLVRQTPRKPIRIWHQSGNRDVDIIFGNIPIANQDFDACAQVPPLRLSVRLWQRRAQPAPRRRRVPGNPPLDLPGPGGPVVTR